MRRTQHRSLFPLPAMLHPLPSSRCPFITPPAGGLKDDTSYMCYYVLACHPPTSDTNLLDCSCDGVIALALSSSVYLWDSESRSVVGRLDQTAPSGQQWSDGRTRSVSCLCWSGDGRILCIGTRRREMQVFGETAALV